MAFDAFLKIDGIPGESTDSKHKGEIDILSWSFGATQTGTAAPGGGGGAGKPSFQDFTFVTKAQASSPLLFLACATGKHIKEAVIVARKAGGGQEEYLKLTFNDVVISAFQQGGDPQGGDDLPVDQIAFNFAKISFEYKPQNKKGSAGETVSVSYDLNSGSVE